jgi:uncharacterized membrane protein YeiH
MEADVAGVFATGAFGGIAWDIACDARPAISTTIYRGGLRCWAKSTFTARARQMTLR